MKKKSATYIPFVLRLVRWYFPKLERFSVTLAARYLFKIFFTPIRYPIPEKEREIAAQASLLTLTIDGKSITAYEWGDGKNPYVLIVHGWAGRATQFRKFIPALETAGYRIISFDGPAHGRSTGKTTNIYEFESVIKHLVELKGVPLAVIAHSFGGGVSLYSIMNGLPVKKLVNIAAPTIGDEIIRTYLNAVRGSWKTGERFKKMIVERYDKPFDEFTSLHFIKHLPGPLDLLLIYDDDDKEVTVDHAHALMKAYPQATLLVTSGLGHTRILKDENVIAAAISFIQK